MYTYIYTYNFGSKNLKVEKHMKARVHDLRKAQKHRHYHAATYLRWGTVAVLSSMLGIRTSEPLPARLGTFTSTPALQPCRKSGSKALR